MPKTKFDKVKSRLKREWGLDIWRNQPSSPGRMVGAWKTGYTVDGYIHGMRRYAYLEDIIRMMDRSLL